MTIANSSNFPKPGPPAVRAITVQAAPPAQHIAAGATARCTKARWGSSGQADKALQKIRRKGERFEKKPTRAYLCQLCKGWHLTSEPI